MLKPALSRARTASRWLTPGIFASLKRYLYLTNYRTPKLLFNGGKILADRILDVLHSLR